MLFFQVYLCPLPLYKSCTNRGVDRSYAGVECGLKLSAITVDNCSTNDSMIGKIKTKLSVDCLLNNGSLLHMRCAAHILNLIVRIGLDVIKHAIDNVRDSVVFLTASPKRIERFEDVCRQMEVPCTRRLGFDCPTRWNSTYLILKTALAYKNVFPRLKLFESHYVLVPSEAEWETAKDVCDRLELFYNVTELFSGTRYPTANMFFPVICRIKMTLNEWLMSSNVVISTMAKSMVAKFDAYWNVIHKLMGVAVVLDPRYKMTLLHFYYPWVYPNDFSEQISNIKQLCYELVEEYYTRMYKETDTESAVHGTVTSTSKGSSITIDSDYQLFVKRMKTNKTNSFITELDHYLEEDVLLDNSQFDILLWWKLNGVKYPVLQTIARNILAIPVSTVVSESAFSSSGRLVSPHRNRLHPNMIEALMCAQSWLWSEVKKHDGKFISLIIYFLFT